MNPEAQKEIIVFNESIIDWEKPIYVVEGAFDSIFLDNAIPMLGKFMSQKLFDVLYEQALLETNQATRVDLYKKMDALVIEKAPVVVLFYDEVIRFTGMGVTGLGINPTNLLELKNVQKN